MTMWKYFLFLWLCIGALENGMAQESTKYLIPCRGGWYLFGEKCYKVQGTSNGLSWANASAQCSEEGGQLATITSKEMRDFMFIFLLLNAGSDAWIGLNDLKVEGQYVWDDGSVLNYTDWEEHQPTSQTTSYEDCVVMRYWTDKKDIGMWNDFECDNQVPYICQQAKNEKRQQPDPRFCSADVGRGWRYLYSCYHIITEKKTWEDAEKYCQKTFEGHLATVLDFRTEYFLNYILSNYNESFWYGIKIREEAQQQWSSGWQVIFNRWEENASFAVDTCALRTSEHIWKRESCALEHSFVCEKALEKPPIEENWSCPDSSKDWKKANGKLCYLIETKESRTWHEAEYECRKKGGSLVNIHSQKELNDLYVQLRPLMRSKYMYIGLHRKLLNEGEFEWTDGSDASYQHWLSGQPSDIKEKCVTLHTNVMRWNDLSCLVKHLYICSAPKVYSAERDEKQCPCKLPKNITEIIEAALKKHILPDNTCTQKESSCGVDSNEKDSTPDTSNSDSSQNACSKEKGAASHETACTLEKDHAPSLKCKNEEHELQIKILNERLNVLRLISKYIGQNPEAVNLVV